MQNVENKKNPRAPVIIYGKFACVKRIKGF